MLTERLTGKMGVRAAITKVARDDGAHRIGHLSNPPARFG
jgi:hypothetical protein